MGSKRERERKKEKGERDIMVPVASQGSSILSNDTPNGNAKLTSNNVTVLRDTQQLRCWMTTIRDATTQGPVFVRAVEQVSRVLMYEGIY